MKSAALLVEGSLDAAVGARLIDDAGGTVSVVYGLKGIDYIRQRLQGFSRAAATPLLVLADLGDTGVDCPVTVRDVWLPYPGGRTAFRLAVKKIESWLLADRRGMASLLRVPLTRIPLDSDRLDDPKATLVSLARRSRSQAVVRAIVPMGTSLIGPGYTAVLMRFVEHWNISEAAKVSSSLAGAVACLPRLLRNGP